MKTLVVYYSRTGKTRFVAEKVASELKADIEEVVDLKNRSGRFGFLRAGYDATRGNETEIGKTQKSPSNFELIVVGTPVWNSRPASAISTYFLYNCCLDAKSALFLIITNSVGFIIMNFDFKD